MNVPGKTEGEVQSETGKQMEDERPEMVFCSISSHVQLKKAGAEKCE